MLRMRQENIVVLTGAGMSAESGLKTFRDHDGLWENYNVMQVASIDGWNENPELVMEFYNQRRKQLKSVKPNKGHLALAELENHHPTQIITQNVDNLHEKAGSRNILHLHGQLDKVRSISHPENIYDWENDLHLGDTGENGGQLRPHIVWFGEEVPLLSKAAGIVSHATKLIIVGTSLQVYPAAGLISYAPPGIDIFYIDPNPQTSYELDKRSNVKIIKGKAVKEVPKLVKELVKL